MPTPDSPFDDFPDLTLPERSDKPPVEPTPAARPTAPRWNVGDRVLAPWEPQFLYAGRVAELRGNEALVDFDDGDAGRVRLDQLRPLVVQRGQKVLSRRQMGPHFFPAEIREVRGEEVCVVFADGRGEEWTRVGALRLPCPAVGPGAEPTRMGSPREPGPPLRPGDRVWAPWDSRLLYAGTVDQVLGREVHVHYDDGKRGWVEAQQVVPLVVPVGLRLLGWKRPGRRYALESDDPARFCPAVVERVEGDRVLLRYDDGDREWDTTAVLALPCEPLGPSARPTLQVARGGGRVGRWLLVVGLGFLFAVLRAGCRAGP